MSYVGPAPANSIIATSDIEDGAVTSAKLGGNIVTPGTLDVNGQEFILDANANTSLTADTDDQVDIKVGGTDVVTLTDSSLVLKGTTPTLTIGDAGTEDTKIVFDGNAQDFHIGLDDTADSLAIGLGSALGTTDHMVFDATGAVTKPLQPCVIAKHNANVSNVTGDGTYYTTLYATEIIDRNADFNGGTGTFTAPVTGVYSVSGYIYSYGIVAATNNWQIDVVTSNRTHSGIVYFATMDVSPTEIASSYAMLVDMDASDTAYVNLRVNNGSKVVDYASNSAISFALIA